MTPQQQASQLLSQGIDRMSVAPQPTTPINPKSFFDFSSMPKQSSNLAGSSAMMPQIPSIWKVETARPQTFMEWIQQSPLKPVIEWGKKLINKVQTGIEQAGTHKQLNDSVLKSIWAEFYDGKPLEQVRQQFPELRHIDDTQLKTMAADFYDGKPIDQIKNNYSKIIRDVNKTLAKDHWNEIIDAILDPILQGGQELLQWWKKSLEEIQSEQEEYWSISAIPNVIQNSVFNAWQWVLWLANIWKNIATKRWEENPINIWLNSIKDVISNPTDTALKIRDWSYDKINNPLKTAEDFTRFVVENPIDAVLMLEWGVQWVKGLKWLSRDVRWIIKNEPIQITNLAWETMTMWRRDFLKQTLDRVSEKAWQGIQQWIEWAKQWLDIAKRGMQWGKELIKKVTPKISVPKWVKSLWNELAEMSFDKNMKITKTNKDAMMKSAKTTPAKFVMENWLDASSPAKIIDNADDLINESMKKKFEALWSIEGNVQLWKAERLVWNKLVAQAKEDLQIMFGKQFDEIKEIDIPDSLKDEFAIVKNIEDIVNRWEATPLQLEAIKSLFDKYNQNLKYDPSKRSMLSSVEKVRNEMMWGIEELWNQVWVNIKELNQKIAWWNALKKAMEQAESRLANNDIFWLWETQMGLIWSALWWWPLWVVLWWWKLISKQWWVQSLLRKSLYTKWLENAWKIKAIASDVASNRVTAQSNITKSLGGDTSNNNVSSAAPKIKKQLIKKK